MPKDFGDSLRRPPFRYWACSCEWWLDPLACRFPLPRLKKSKTFFLLRLNDLISSARELGSCCENVRFLGSVAPADYVFNRFTNVLPFQESSCALSYLRQTTS